MGPRKAESSMTSPPPPTAHPPHPSPLPENPPPVRAPTHRIPLIAFAPLVTRGAHLPLERKQDEGGPWPPTHSLPQPFPLHERSPCTLLPRKARQLQGALEAPGALGSHLGQWDQGDHVHPDAGVEGGTSGTRAGMGSRYVDWAWRVEWGRQSTYRGPLLSCRANWAWASTLARKPNASCWAQRTTLPRGALKTGVRG